MRRARVSAEEHTNLSWSAAGAAYPIISGKAVSKWERGLSCFDISLLSPISEILGVTTTELLNGERAGVKETTNVEIIVANDLEYGEKTVKRKINLTQNII